MALFEAPFFEAQTVQISGNARTSHGAILDVLALADDQALLTFDTATARETIHTLPWVEDVDVLRQWPSTVRVVIREHGVAAAVGTPSGQDWVILGEDRRALEFRATPPASVPLIVAPESVVENARLGAPVDGVDRAFAISRDVPGQLQPWIATWSVTGSGDVWANLAGSAHANFGPTGDYRTQFVSLASILEGDVSLTCIRSIDLSIADTPVVDRDADCILVSLDLYE